MTDFDENLEEPAAAPDLVELRKELTDKEKTFCDHYLGEAHFCASRAARMAGYTGNVSTLTTAGWKIMRRAHVRAYINAVMDETAMAANENLVRLATIARGSVDDVLSDEGIFFDLKKARANGSIHLIRKIKTKQTIKGTKTEITSLPDDIPADIKAILDEFWAEAKVTKETVLEEVEFELYSATEALGLLGKYHKLFTDKIEAKIEDTADVVFYIPDNGRDKAEN